MGGWRAPFVLLLLAVALAGLIPAPVAAICVASPEWGDECFSHCTGTECRPGGYNPWNPSGTGGACDSGCCLVGGIYYCSESNNAPTITVYAEGAGTSMTVYALIQSAGSTIGVGTAGQTEVHYYDNIPVRVRLKNGASVIASGQNFDNTNSPLAWTYGNLITMTGVPVGVYTIEADYIPSGRRQASGSPVNELSNYAWSALSGTRITAANTGGTTLYACNGAYYTSTGDDGGLDFYSRVHVGGPSNACCDNDGCVRGNTCIGPGVMTSGSPYGDQSWICMRRTYGSPATTLKAGGFYQCTSDGVGVDIGGVGGIGRHCCTDMGVGSSPRYQWVSGFCSAAGGTRRVGGTAWGTTPTGQGVTYSCSSYTGGSDPGCTDGSCCNDGSTSTSSGTCTDPALYPEILDGSYNGDDWICAPEMGELNARLNPSFYRCTSSVTYVNLGTTTGGFDGQPRGQYESGAGAFCCVEKGPLDGTCTGPKFVSGICEDLCGADGADCDCDAGSCFGQEFFSNPWPGNFNNPASYVQGSPQTNRAPAVCCDPDSQCVSADGCVELGDFISGNAQWTCAKPPGSSMINPADFICQQDNRGNRLDTGGGVLCCTNADVFSTNPNHPDCGTAATCGANGCESGESCSNCPADCGTCPPTCTNECSAGHVRCVGSNGYEGCADYNGDGCTEWGGYDTCPVGEECVGPPLVCAPICDIDGDGQNGMRLTDQKYRSGPVPPTSCTNRVDCRDAVGQTTIKNLQSEDPVGPTNYCTDGWDNDCEGIAVSAREADYDGWSAWTGNPVNGSTREGLGPAPKGDSACLVGISRTAGIVAAPSIVDTYAECTTNFTISCTANVGRIRSIEVSGPSKCSWRAWSGVGSRTAEFTCERPTTDGAFGYSCFVNQSESYAANNVTHNSSVSTSVTFDCLRPVGGIVRDAARQTAISGAVVSYNGSTVTKVTDSAGVYNFTGVDEVLVGNYNFLANKSGYYANRRTNVNVSPSPTLVDFNLSEEQCTAQCTFGGVCDYDRCLGRNGCPTAAEFNPAFTSRNGLDLFFATCQGAPHGTRREYSETEMANCCLGAVEPKAFSAAPMAVESCASQLIPFERIVNYNGKPHLLTVVTYRPCE